MAGPLQGLMVIDASWGMPGSVGSLLLGDYGAHVVKVERPGGPPDVDLPQRRAWERNKWSITLDVEDPHDVAVLRDLAARADVFVESFGYGVADRLGLGHENLRAANPALVYCSITGYGHDGPWRERPAYEALVAARMGFMAEQPGHRPGPIFLGHQSIGYTTGLLVGIGTLAALRARRLTGRGQLVDVSLLDGVLGQAPMNWWWNEKGESYLATEAEGTFGRRRTVMDMFLCADDEYIMIHTGGQGAFKAAMDVLGVGHRIKPITGKLEMSVMLDDDEYDAARNEVPKAFRTKARAEWLTLLHQADVAAVPVLRPGEVLHHEQVKFAGVPVDVVDDELGTTRQLGPGVRFAATPAAPPVRAPRVGEHNDRVRELIARPVTREDFAGRALAHPLDGIRILDFSSFFAAGYGSKQLSDMGADVIKVENIMGDQMRPLPDPFEASQRGKRDIAIDLKSPEALAIIHDLVRTADIVVHNMRPGKSEKLGIAYDELKQIKPNLIYCYQPGWGSAGPSKDLKSFAPLMSALTGLMVEAAGEGNQPVRRARASEDYYSGLLVANVMLMALDHRQRTGEGQYLESPQLHASLFTVTQQILDADGRLLESYVLDREQMGFGPLYRLYKTSDGFICIAAFGHEARARLGTALGVDTTAVADEVLAKALEARFVAMTVDGAFEKLDAAGVPCEIARPEPFMPEFFWEEWALESGRVFEHHHAEFGWIREVGLVQRFSETPGLSKGPAPLLGEHSVEILTELGYSDDRIAELVAGPVFAPGGSTGERAG